VNDVEAGVARLVERYRLATDAGGQLVALAQAVVADTRAPTAVREPHHVVRDHLADSLVALEVEHLRAARTIADIGSGAGFPGLPLAVALPDAWVSLVESNARKCDFIARAAARSRASNVSVVNARVEAWDEGLVSFDAVTARALAPLAVVAEYAAPLLRDGGVVVAWRGARDRAAESEAARAADLLGLETLEPRPVQPYPEAANRHLHLMVKVAETPSAFPRRPGVAAKRPLGR
jgi:16S rRNA (guanine527-N7)-methyltransferase